MSSALHPIPCASGEAYSRFDNIALDAMLPHLTLPPGATLRQRPDGTAALYHNGVCVNVYDDEAGDIEIWVTSCMRAVLNGLRH